MDEQRVNIGNEIRERVLSNVSKELKSGIDNMYVHLPKDMSCKTC